MLVVYFVNSLIAQVSTEAWNQSTGWRWMFACGTLPAIIFWALVFTVPESPRWLSKRGKNHEAFSILSRVGGEAHAQSELKEIEESLAQEQGTIWELFKPGIRAALILGVVMAILQQITGINAVIYYAPEIFKSAGMRSTAAINATVFVGIINLVFTVVSMWLVDRVGRKPILVFTAAGMGVSLFLLGGAFHYGMTQGPWVLLFVLCYIGAFAVAMGPVVWVVIAEIYPTKIRGSAMGIATVVLWISDFMVSEFFPYMLEKLHGEVFFVYAVICVVAFIVFWAFVPETKGKTLEEIEKMWEGR
jgi:sugar porter (SP) family MFS transporter